MPDKLNQKITLNDGRIICFAEYGEPNGIPVFHFNGSGGSRLEHPDLNILNKLNIRYLSTDRPGHGNSSPFQTRELLDWPNDIRQIADYLNIDKFYVLGWSAGGPHALACAHELSGRIIGGSIVSGLAPPNRPNPFKGYTGLIWFLMIVGRKYPKLIYMFRRLAAKQINKSGENFGAKFVKSLPKEDQSIFKDQSIKDMLIEDIKEGYKQGGDGPARDDLIINFPWGFDISNIQTHFDIWQGDLDKNVPLNQGYYQAEVLPNNTFHLMKNKAHMFLLEDWEHILLTLIKSK